jgi:hypothetical protein
MRRNHQAAGRSLTAGELRPTVDSSSSASDREPLIAADIGPWPRCCAGRVSSRCAQYRRTQWPRPARGLTDAPHANRAVERPQPQRCRSRSPFRPSDSQSIPVPAKHWAAPDRTRRGAPGRGRHDQPRAAERHLALVDSISQSQGLRRGGCDPQGALSVGSPALKIGARRSMAGGGCGRGDARRLAGG